VTFGELKKKGGVGKTGCTNKNSLKGIYRFVTSYLLSVNVTHEKTKTADYTTTQPVLKMYIPL
jgi:hypothetical protein